MADKISIHPKIDSGIQPAAKDFTGGDLICQCVERPRTGDRKDSVRAQSCVRLHEMLEAERRVILDGGGCPARQAERNRQCE